MSTTFVRGVSLDSESRCAHYHGPTDIIANRFGCCDTYYACQKCHEELAGHEANPWPERRKSEPAVRCGHCGDEMTGDEYFDSDSQCQKCGAAFNPGCAAHRHLYFDW